MFQMRYKKHGYLEHEIEVSLFVYESVQVTLSNRVLGHDLCKNIN